MTAQDVVGRWGLLPKCGFREDPGTIDQIVDRGFLASGAARPGTVLHCKAELVRRPLGITTAALPASPDPPTLGLSLGPPGIPRDPTSTGFSEAHRRPGSFEPPSSRVEVGASSLGVNPCFN